MEELEISVCSDADRTCLADLDDSQNQDARKGITGRGQRGFGLFLPLCQVSALIPCLYLVLSKVQILFPCLSWQLPLALKLFVCNLFPRCLVSIPACSVQVSLTLAGCDGDRMVWDRSDGHVHTGAFSRCCGTRWLSERELAVLWGSHFNPHL